MQIAYIDLETDRDNHHILDMGAICGQQHIHTTHLPELLNSIQAADFLCGHHFLHHDFPHLQAHLAQLNFHAQDVIDTLLLSPLLFPARPYHALDKDYKTQFAESNNPLSDCLITRDLLDSEQQAFFRLPATMLLNSFAKLSPNRFVITRHWTSSSRNIPPRWRTHWV